MKIINSKELPQPSSKMFGNHHLKATYCMALIWWATSISFERWVRVASEWIPSTRRTSNMVWKAHGKVLSVSSKKHLQSERMMFRLIQSWILIVWGILLVMSCFDHCSANVVQSSAILLPSHSGSGHCICLLTGLCYSTDLGRSKSISLMADLMAMGRRVVMKLAFWEVKLHKGSCDVQVGRSTINSQDACSDQTFFHDFRIYSLKMVSALSISPPLIYYCFHYITG